VNLGTDIANASVSADSEADIPAAVAGLLQELARSQRV